MGRLFLCPHVALPTAFIPTGTVSSPRVQDFRPGPVPCTYSCQHARAECTGIIGHLEGLGARLAARLPLVNREETIQKLKVFNLGLSELARARHSDANRIFELDLNFHRVVVEAAAGPRLLELHKTVQPQAERYWRLYAGAILDELDQSIGEHDEIMDAILKGDADRAEVSIQINWENGVKRLSRVIEDLGERGSW